MTDMDLCSDQENFKYLFLHFKFLSIPDEALNWHLLDKRHVVASPRRLFLNISNKLSSS